MRALLKQLETAFEAQQGTRDGNHDPVAVQRMFEYFFALAGMLGCVMKTSGITEELHKIAMLAALADASRRVVSVFLAITAAQLMKADADFTDLTNAGDLFDLLTNMFMQMNKTESVEEKDGSDRRKELVDMYKSCSTSVVQILVDVGLLADVGAAPKEVLIAAMKASMEGLDAAAYGVLTAALMRSMDSIADFIAKNVHSVEIDLAMTESLRLVVPSAANSSQMGAMKALQTKFGECDLGTYRPTAPNLEHHFRALLKSMTKAHKQMQTVSTVATEVLFHLRTDPHRPDDGGASDPFPRPSAMCGVGVKTEPMSGGLSERDVQWRIDEALERQRNELSQRHHDAMAARGAEHARDEILLVSLTRIFDAMTALLMMCIRVATRIETGITATGGDLATTPGLAILPLVADGALAFNADLWDHTCRNPGPTQPPCTAHENLVSVMFTSTLASKLEIVQILFGNMGTSVGEAGRLPFSLVSALLYSMGVWSVPQCVVQGTTLTTEQSIAALEASVALLRNGHKCAGLCAAIACMTFSIEDPARCRNMGEDVAATYTSVGTAFATLGL